MQKQRTKSVASLKLAFLNSIRSFDAFVVGPNGQCVAGITVANTFCWIFRCHWFVCKIEITVTNSYERLERDASVIAKPNHCNRWIFAPFSLVGTCRKYMRSKSGTPLFYLSQKHHDAICVTANPNTPPTPESF